MAEETSITKTEPLLPVIIAKEPEDITVIAANPTEMEASQKKLVAWAKRKLAAKESEVVEAQTNLDIAKKRKWRIGPFETIVRKAKRKAEFYEKILGAFKAGYCIVPNMDMEVFAIRTTRKNPKENFSSNSSKEGQYLSSPWVKDQKTNTPPIGEGRYVDPTAYMKTDTTDHTNQKGEKIVTLNKWADEFDEEIDFPFKLAKPQILDATGEALAHKIFDEVGILPRRRGADPMVIGRVCYRDGYVTKDVCFVISWFVDTREL